MPTVMSPRRLVAITLAVVVSLHILIGLIREDYLQLSLYTIRQQLVIAQKTWLQQNYTMEFDAFNGTTDPQPRIDLMASNISGLAVPPALATRRANATFVLLCRNSDLRGVISSIRHMEDRFNRNYKYPWVLLNEQPFTDEFKTRVRILTDAPIQFGQISPDDWYQPPWIDEKRAEQGRLAMMRQHIIYADSVPYRNMCRFNSGFFFQHELLQPYRYYWRVEPDVTYFCDVDYDPFLFMQDNDKVYGWTLSLLEWQPTIPTLWSTVREFMDEHPEYVSANNSMEFLSDNGGLNYNLCHFWSNFEIADMDFWRGDAYQAFFKHLDSKGGFYYERWGDAPVHSMAAALFARKDQIHFFSDMGYMHPPFQHCPYGSEWVKGRCSCNPQDSFDYQPASCLRKFQGMFK
ncbi:glycosyltransferase 15 family protein [Pleurotus pulmonarius]